MTDDELAQVKAIVRGFAWPCGASLRSILTDLDALPVHGTCETCAEWMTFEGRPCGSLEPGHGECGEWERASYYAITRKEEYCSCWIARGGNE